MRLPRIDKLAYLLFAVVLAVVGQVYLTKHLPLVDAGIFYGFAGLFLVLAIRRGPDYAVVIMDKGTAAHGFLVARGPLVLVVLALISTGLSLWRFHRTWSSGLGWMLTLFAALAVLVAAHWQEARRDRGASREMELQRGDRANDGKASRILHYTVLVAIIGVAIFLRTWRLESLPQGLWYDEADNGLEAVRIISNSAYRPIYSQSTNLPSAFIYPQALAVAHMGHTKTALRVVAAGFGVLTVIAFYLLARFLFDPAIGLVAAFLMAVSRWDVNWSRIGMHGVTTPLLTVLAVWLLLRAMRSGKLGTYALAGIAWGLGMWFYVPMRLFVFVIIVFLAYQVIVRRGYLRLHRYGLAFYLAAALITAGPIVELSARSPSVFFERMLITSVFRSHEVSEMPDVLLGSTRKHLLMFNYEGDRNGRHNLPGEPMLDFTVAFLAVLGASYCLYRWRRPLPFLLLVWFGVMLSGGILTLDFEAPQSLRAIGTLPVALLFACIAVDKVRREVGYVFGQRRRAYFMGVLIVPLLFSGYVNYDTYFHKQAHDRGSWEAFSTAETAVAEKLNALRAAPADVYASPLYWNHLTIQFMAPNPPPYRILDQATDLPLKTRGQDAVLFIDPIDEPFLRRLMRYYPEAAVREVRPPGSGGNPTMWEVTVPRAQIEGSHGLMADYRGASGEEVREPVSAIDVDGGKALPLPGPVQAEWSGVLNVTAYGAYRLVLDGSPSAQLILDGGVVLGNGQRDGRFLLAQGSHMLLVKDQHAAGERPRLLWQPPDGVLQPIPTDNLYAYPIVGGGLLGKFYRGLTPSGQPALERIDPDLSYYFHRTVLPRPYTVEWTGTLLPPKPGRYEIGLQAIGRVQLSLDGRVLIDSDEPGKYVSATVDLTADRHDLRILFVDNRGYSNIYLYWRPPGGSRELVPQDSLLPAPPSPAP